MKNVARALEWSGLEARFLELEITESVVMENAAEADRDARGAARASAWASPIDDFGTGYSWLNYFQRFPSTR